MSIAVCEDERRRKDHNIGYVLSFFFFSGFGVLLGLSFFSEGGPECFFLMGSVETGRMPVEEEEEEA